MTPIDLRELYRGYLACLNDQDWRNLDSFVHAEAEHNGRPLGVPGYRATLEQDYCEIPDLRFEAELVVVELPFVAARLRFVCAPVGDFLGLPVNGKRISFTENVFYEFAERKVRRVWSVIDKGAIKAQL